MLYVFISMCVYYTVHFKKDDAMISSKMEMGNIFHKILMLAPH